MPSRISSTIVDAENAPDSLTFQVGYRSGNPDDPNIYWSNAVELEIED